MEGGKAGGQQAGLTAQENLYASCVMANKLATGTSKEVFWPTSWPSFFAWVVAAKEDESARCLAGCCPINAFHGYVGPRGMRFAS